MEPGPRESLSTLQKLAIAQEDIVRTYLHGQKPEGAKELALNFANAFIEDSVFNRNNYTGLDEKGRTQREDMLRSFQEAVDSANQGDNKKLKNILLEDARVSLEAGDLDSDPAGVQQGLAFLNLLFSIPDQDQS